MLDAVKFWVLEIRIERRHSVVRRQLTLAARHGRLLNVFSLVCVSVCLVGWIRALEISRSRGSGIQAKDKINV